MIIYSIKVMTDEGEQEMQLSNGVNINGVAKVTITDGDNKVVVFILKA